MDRNRLAKLDRTITELGITDLRAQKEHGFWIARLEAEHEGQIVVAIATGKKFSSCLVRAMDRLHKLKRGEICASPS